MLDFSGANLSGVDLSGENLAGIDLSGANLAGANLSGANLSGSNLAGANMAGIDLSGANLSGAWLYLANLSRANLTGADMSLSNLSESNLFRANLTRVNLTRAKLISANLLRANLTRANMTLANLSGVYMREANMAGANLTQVTLKNANLSAVNLSGAFMREAELIGAILKDSILSEIIGCPIGDLDGCGTISFAFGRFLSDSMTLDMSLNHINNNDSGSFLTFIHHSALSNDQKIDIFKQLITHLKTLMPDLLVPIREALVDILGLPAYVSDPDINIFVVERCLVEKLQEANSTPTQFLESQLKMLGDYIVHKLSSDAGFSLERHVGSEALNQLLFQLKTLPSLDHLQKIQDAWHLEIGGLVDSVNELNLGNMIYFVRGTHAVVCEERCFEEIMSGGSPLPGLDQLMSFNRNDMTWENINLQEQGPILDGNSKTHWLQFFPCLESIYREASQSGERVNYLSMIFPGEEGLRVLFKVALRGPVSFVKIVNQGSDSYKKLSGCIKPLIDTLPVEGTNVQERNSLREIHKNNVLDLFGLAPNGSNQNEEMNHKRGFLFLVLGSFMAKYTSSSIFGEETKSPEPLRSYADALLKTAHDYGVLSAEQYRDCSDRLLGLNGGFACTSVLYNSVLKPMIQDILRHTSDQDFKDIAALIPATW